MVYYINMNMKKQKVCTILAGVMNLLYALALTAGIGIALIMGVMMILGMGSATEIGEVIALAVAGPIIILLAIGAIVLMIIPCVLSWVASIGMLVKGSKNKSPAGFAVLSIVIHSLLIAGGLIAAIGMLVGGIVWGLGIGAAVIVPSVVNIVLSAIGRSGWKYAVVEEQPEEDDDLLAD